MSGSRMGGGVRRAIGSLVTLALLAAALGFYIAAPRLSVTAGPRPATNAEPSATQSLSQFASPAPTAIRATSSGTATATTKAGGSSPDRTLPPGPGGREPGIRLLATPTSEREFEVVETVRVAQPRTELALAVPDLSAAGPSLQGTRPVAEDVKVIVGGRSIKLASRTVRRPVTVPLPHPVDLVQLRYRLRGVTVVNSPSSAGRALGGLAPMATDVPGDLPVAITVRGRSVLNLSCPRLSIADQACAAGHSPKLRVNRDLARRDALVLVQFDLPGAQVGAPG